MPFTQNEDLLLILTNWRRFPAYAWDQSQGLSKHWWSGGRAIREGDSQEAGTYCVSRTLSFFITSSWLWGSASSPVPGCLGPQGSPPPEKSRVPAKKASLMDLCMCSDFSSWANDPKPGPAHWPVPTGHPPGGPAREGWWAEGSSPHKRAESRNMGTFFFRFPSPTICFLSSAKMRVTGDPIK